MLATRDAPQSGVDTPARRAAEQRATFDMLEQALNTPAHMNHETASLADNEHQQRTQREDAGTAKKRRKEQQQVAGQGNGAHIRQTGTDIHNIYQHIEQRFTADSIS